MRPSGPTNRSWLTAWKHTRATQASLTARACAWASPTSWARSLDTRQAQISRVQLALDPPELSSAFRAMRASSTNSGGRGK
jgi:hypothetical protein